MFTQLTSLGGNIGLQTGNHLGYSHGTASNSTIEGSGYGYDTGVYPLMVENQTPAQDPRGGYFGESCPGTIENQMDTQGSGHNCGLADYGVTG